MGRSLRYFRRRAKGSKGQQRADTMRTTTTITLYAKAGCHLCDEARAWLEEAVADPNISGVEIAEVDIRRDPTLFEQYRYRIPVITVDGIERLEGRIEASEVEELLRSLSQS